MWMIFRSIPVDARICLNRERSFWDTRERPLTMQMDRAKTLSLVRSTPSLGDSLALLGFLKGKKRQALNHLGRPPHVEESLLIKKRARKCGRPERCFAKRSDCKGESFSPQRSCSLQGYLLCLGAKQFDQWLRIRQPMGMMIAPLLCEDLKTAF